MDLYFYISYANSFLKTLRITKKKRIIKIWDFEEYFFQVNNLRRLHTAHKEMQHIAKCFLFDRLNKELYP